MSYRNHRWLGLPGIALALLAGGTVAGRADAPVAAVSPADAQMQLKNALSRLNAVAPRLDAQTRQNLPHIREIITRVVLHPETATPSEKKIAKIFMPQTRGIFDDLAKEATTTEVQAAVKTVSSTPIEFLASQGQVPGGAAKGIVYLKNPDAPAPTELVEIPAGTTKFPVDKRARIVAKRLEAAHSSDPFWWTNLTVSRLNNQVIVAVAGSKDPVITADPAFAKLQGMTPEDLANSLVDKIRSTVDPDKHNTRDLATDDELSPVEKLKRANLLRQRADDAYGQGNSTGAEMLYKHAITLVPGYSVPYIRLADLYLEQHRPDDAKDILQQAQGVADMDADGKTAVAQKFAAVQQKF